MSSKLIVVMFVVAALGLVLAVVLVERASPNQEEHTAFTALLAERRALDQEIAKHALEARFLFAANYDQLAKDDSELRRLEIESQRLVPSFLAQTERAKIEQALSRYTALSDQYWRLIERFKSQNALLRNSVNYFPSLVSEVEARAKEPELVRSVNELDRLTLSLALKNDPLLAGSQAKAMGNVQALTVGKLAKADSREVDLMLAHARAIAVHKRETDLLLTQLLDLPMGQARQEVGGLYQRAYAIAQERGHLFGHAVDALAIFLITIVAYVGLRLRRASVVLSRANDRLEVAVQERTLALRAEMAENARMEVELRHAQKLETVGQLAAGLAHEINTPIQYVGDNVHFLREAFGDIMRLVDASDEPSSVAQIAEDVNIEFLRTEVPDALERTDEGTKQVASIVKAMKAFAQASPDKAPLDLKAALENTLIVARNEYRYVADVETELAEMPEVTCNASGVRHVLLSLIVNAAHAIADKVGESGDRGVIAIRSEVKEAHVLISIADSGTGIADAVQPRVFDPFFTTKEPGRGSGQGLTISQSIVKQHAGKLWFETKLGIGTTFFVQLPTQATAPSQLERKAS